MPISVVGHAADASGRAQARSRKLHAQAPWYVVQVTAGREDHMRSVIEQAVEAEEKILSELAEGYVEDGVLHVTSGPLVGREASIVHVSHRKKVAYLELEAFGRTITAQLGINITRSKSCKKKQKRE